MTERKTAVPSPIDENDAEIIRDVLDGVIALNNRLGHQLIAMQSICGWLLADRCMGQPDPLDAVQTVGAMLLGTAEAVADNAGSRTAIDAVTRDTSGSTEVFEKVGSIAEQMVRFIVKGQGRAAAA